MSNRRVRFNENLRIQTSTSVAVELVITMEQQQLRQQKQKHQHQAATQSWQVGRVNRATGNRRRKWRVANGIRHTTNKLRRSQEMKQRATNMHRTSECMPQVASVANARHTHSHTHSGYDASTAFQLCSAIIMMN
ncbi:unnamed protein product [Ceratitis capitata]|uniref:(Mediterranean fruit fly) hypothetical protein n=1 Tax=Ceratitis capitata TaxID=7213 RepID=A0A811VDB1_CERCA|nr:unnamed protein product [Ceratitis capitata]